MCVTERQRVLVFVDLTTANHLCSRFVQKPLKTKVSDTTRRVFLDLNHLFLLQVKHKKTTLLLLNEEDKCWLRPDEPPAAQRRVLRFPPQTNIWGQAASVCVQVGVGPGSPASVQGAATPTAAPKDPTIKNTYSDSRKHAPAPC